MQCLSRSDRLYTDRNTLTEQLHRAEKLLPRPWKNPAFTSPLPWKPCGGVAMSA